VALLRRFLETSLRRRARPVGGGEIGAAVERVVGRRLQPGLRSRARGAPLDPRVEQLLQRRRDRRPLLARRPGARRAGRSLSGVLLGRLRRIALRALRCVRVVIFRHGSNMGRPKRRRKGGSLIEINALYAARGTMAGLGAARHAGAPQGAITLALTHPAELG